eukprot:444931_1
MNLLLILLGMKAVIAPHVPGKSGINTAFTSLKKDNKHVIPGDIVKISTLRNQTDDEKQRRVSIMNKERFGIVIKRNGAVSQINTKNSTEYLIRSLLNENATLGIHPKHLKRLSKLFIHDVSGCNLSYIAGLWDNISLQGALPHEQQPNGTFRKMMMIPSATNVQMHSIATSTIGELPRSEAFAFQCIIAIKELLNGNNLKNIGKLTDFISKFHLVCHLNIVGAIIEKLIQNSSPVQQTYLGAVAMALLANKHTITANEHGNNRLLKYDDEAIKQLHHQNKQNVLMNLRSLLNVNDKQHGQKYRLFYGRFFQIIIDAMEVMIEAVAQNRSQFKFPRTSLKSCVLADVMDSYFRRVTESHDDCDIIVDDAELLKNLEILFAAHINKVW